LESVALSALRLPLVQKSGFQFILDSSDYKKNVSFLGNPGVKVEGRKVTGQGGSHELGEVPEPYKGILGHENGVLRPQNGYFMENTVCRSIG